MEIVSAPVQPFVSYTFTRGIKNRQMSVGAVKTKNIYFLRLQFSIEKLKAVTTNCFI